MVRIIRMVSAVLLVVSLFVTTDFAVNLAGALVPELQDGIPYHSVLQSWFGLLEGSLTTRADFFQAFAVSAWISFVLFAWNMALAVVSWLQKK